MTEINHFDLKQDKAVDDFKMMCRELRNEMIRLLKSGMMDQDECDKVSEYFKLKLKDGFEIDFKKLSRKDVEQLVKRKNPKVHLGHAIESVRMMNIHIKDSGHYYNLLMKVAEDPRCQV